MKTKQKKHPRNKALNVKLRKNERKQLEGYARSRSLPHSLVTRARIILLASQGKTNIEIGKHVGLSRINVGKWRKRFITDGVQGLYDQLRPGRPRTISDEQVSELLTKTLQEKPKNAIHWTVRSISEECGISKSTVQRIWSTLGVQPHRHRHFKLSNDPFFIEKVRDIVGLYLNPPEKAMVLCVDEKSQCQALERTQPVLPIGLGYVEGITHDYVRHGTLTLFAALDVATGKVISKCTKRHRHQEFLSFLKQIEKNVPSKLDVHIVADNYGSHKHPKVTTWLLQHPRFHMHFTPTYSSWLNQVERWFGIITQKVIRRGSFKSIKALRYRIDRFVRDYNSASAPFIWTATAESIFKKIANLCNKINGTAH